MIPAATVIKAKNLAYITASIIQKTHQLNIKPSGLKFVKLFYLAGSADRKKCISHDLLVANILINAAPELFIFTIHALKNKKTITNCHCLLWNNTKTKQKKSKLKQCIMRHSEAVFQGFYTLAQLYAIIVLQYLPN